jgi:hypothetical protein
VSSGQVITSWPARAAATAPTLPRHDRTVAPGASPPSRISSQPRSRRPREVLVDAADEPALQRVLVGHAAFTHQLLRPRIRPPLVLRALVATDVHEGGGEELDDLVEDVAEELDRALLHVEHVRVDAPFGPRLQLCPRDAEVGVRSDRRLRVAGELDLGHDGDAPRGRIRHDLADVVLRVEAAVRPAVHRGVGPGAHLGLRSPPAHLGEERIPADLDPPSLIVREMEVQDVETVHRQEIDETQDLPGGDEVPRHIEHGTAPPERGSVLDQHRGGRPRDPRDGSTAVDGVREQLQEGLRPPIPAAVRGGPDLDPVRCHLEPVRLVLESGVEDEAEGVDDRAVPHILQCRQRETGHRREGGSEERRRPGEHPVGTDPGVSGQLEGAGSRLDALRTRDESNHDLPFGRRRHRAPRTAARRRCFGAVTPSETVLTFIRKPSLLNRQPSNGAR